MDIDGGTACMSCDNCKWLTEIRLRFTFLHYPVEVHILLLAVSLPCGSPCPAITCVALMGRYKGSLL